MLDTQNVFVIIGRNWTKDKIIKEIVAEGYKHNFFFSDGHNFSELVKKLEISNEVWTFGNVDGLEIYKYVERNGMDCWRMGA